MFSCICVYFEGGGDFGKDARTGIFFLGEGLIVGKVYMVLA